MKKVLILSPIDPEEKQKSLAIIQQLFYKAIMDSCLPIAPQAMLLEKRDVASKEGEEELSLILSLYAANVDQVWLIGDPSHLQMIPPLSAAAVAKVLIMHIPDPWGLCDE